MKTSHKSPPRDHLEAVGKAIYGDAYKSPLSRALKVDLRTLQRWVSADSDLAWDHGVITDLRGVLADEHAEAVRDEAELRGVLADLDDAILYRELRAANGDQEPVSFGDWDSLSGWQPPWRPSTTSDYSMMVGLLKVQLHNETLKVRDLENQIAILKRPKGMHFSISAGE